LAESILDFFTSYSIERREVIINGVLGTILGKIAVAYAELLPYDFAGTQEIHAIYQILVH
jgi:hypothetical protein